MNHVSVFLRVLALSIAVLAWGSPQASAGEGVPTPSPAKAFKGAECVEPSDVMRRNHMDYLTHQRDETLREGIRGKKYSLKACVDCHATTSPDVAGGKVRTLKPFCSECHSYAAVSIDCFACHTGAATDAIKTGALKNSEIDAHIAEYNAKSVEGGIAQ